MLALLLNAALADPGALVALGDGLVAGAALTPPADAVPGGWVSVVGDCLEERLPGRFSVVDRTVDGDTAAALAARMADVRALAPQMAVVALGAQELAVDQPDLDALRAQVGAVLAALAEPPVPVVLVGVVPRALKRHGPDPVTAGNAALAEVAAAHPHVAFANPSHGWPRDPERHSALVGVDGRLSDLGHVHVGATVCAAVQAAAARAVPAQ